MQLFVAKNKSRMFEFHIIMSFTFIDRLLIIKIGSSFSGHRLANPNRTVKSMNAFIKATLYEKNQNSKFKFYTS